MKSVFKVGAILLFITMSVAFLLSIVNEATKDIILQNENKKISDALTEIFYDVENLNADEATKDFGENIKKFYIIKDSDNTVGYCVQSSAMGFNGNVDILVGIDLDGNVCGVRVLFHSETVGIGTMILNPDFLDGFTGVSEEIFIKKARLARMDILTE